MPSWKCMAFFVILNTAKYELLRTYELETEQPKRPVKLDKRELISLAFELGFIIALPILAFGYAGKWLDLKWGTTPFITLAGILLAIVSTSIWIYKKFKTYF